MIQAEADFVVYYTKQRNKLVREAQRQLAKRRRDEDPEDVVQAAAADTLEDVRAKGVFEPGMMLTAIRQHATNRSGGSRDENVIHIYRATTKRADGRETMPSKQPEKSTSFWPTQIFGRTLAAANEPMREREEKAA